MSSQCTPDRLRKTCTRYCCLQGLDSARPRQQTAGGRCACAAPRSHAHVERSTGLSCGDDGLSKPGGTDRGARRRLTPEAWAELEYHDDRGAVESVSTMSRFKFKSNSDGCARRPRQQGSAPCQCTQRICRDVPVEPLLGPAPASTGRRGAIIMMSN